jgi:inhibitor of cysteine peptidase
LLIRCELMLMVPRMEDTDRSAGLGAEHDVRRRGAAVLVLACLAMGCNMNQVVRLDQTFDKRTIVLHLHQMLEVKLPENPTTGFRWDMKDSGTPVCVERGSSFDAPSGGLGKGGARRFLFEAVQSGTGEIVLVYRRTWENTPPARTFTLSVHVEQ